MIYGDMLSLMDYGKMADEFVKHPDAIGMQKMQRTGNYADADVAELAADREFSENTRQTTH